MSAFDEALNTSEREQSRLSRFGASDTEPRGVFRDLLEAVYNGDDPQVPDTVRGWQLFSGMDGNEKAARDLSVAARKAVDAAKSDVTGLARYVRAM